MKQCSKENLHKIIDFFGFEGEFTGSEPFGNGHINETLLLHYDVRGEDKRYVLQGINKYVFNHPDELMANTMAITQHLRKKVIARGGDPDREVITVVPAKNGDIFYIDDDGDYWRITAYVENAESHETAASAEELREAGRAFGEFQSDLSDFPAETLYYTIPEFHDTKVRFERFKKIVAEDRLSRAASCREEIDFILERGELARFFAEAFERGEIPIRVTHNDTKINNLLIDTDTGKAVCVLDLDTVMPGIAISDFGDAIRIGTSTAAEDERDVSKVSCDLTLYDAFTCGFIEGCGGKLTRREIELLPMGALVITYELAIRFLSDYLEGDLYFKIDYPEHNLVRTRTQLKMVREFEAKMEETERIIRKYM